MKQKTLFSTAAVSLFLVTNLVLPNISLSAEAAVEPATEPKSKPVYSVSEYSPERDPARDLEMTIARAKQENKRILIQVGGEWCGWCHLMNDYFHQNAKVASALENGFIIMKVNFSQENKNEGFLKKYPQISGYPYLFVLENDGSLLHAQETGRLEEGRGYSETAMLEFLKKWTPKQMAEKPER
jgi:thiol:disulfide interchange protein